MKRNTSALPVIGPGGNERGPGNQAKAITKAGYPKAKSEGKCAPNKPGQKGSQSRTHQGLYN